MFLKLSPLFNTTTRKSRAELCFGNVRGHSAFLPSPLPGLLGLFDLWLNSEQQQSRNQWDGWILIPREVRKQRLDHLLKGEKQDILSGFISHSQGLTNTILLFSSALRSISNMSQFVLLSSLSLLPQKVWTINEEGTHVPRAGTCTGPFLLAAPPNACVPSWLSAALHRKTTKKQIIFCKAATEGAVKSSLCVNIS